MLEGQISPEKFLKSQTHGFEKISGLARQAEVEKERREEAKKHEDKMVPTEWQAELQDKRLVCSIARRESQLLSV